MEAAPGLVGVMECGVVLMQLVKVSLHMHAIDSHALNYIYLHIIPVVCPVLALENGDIMYTDDSRRVGTDVTYSCIVGYRLAREPEITCQLSDNNMATWSESLPMCKGVSMLLNYTCERHMKTTLNTTLKQHYYDCTC